MLDISIIYGFGGHCSKKIMKFNMLPEKVQTVLN